MEAKTALILLLVIPLASAPVIYLVGRISFRLLHGNTQISRWLALLSMAATWVPLVVAGREVIKNGPIDWLFGSVMLRLDGLGLLLAGTVLALMSMVTIFSFRYMDGDADEEKYYALLPALSGAMIGLGCSHDLFNLWVWFEMMAITSYLLVAFYRDQKGALEATVKYLVQSAVGSVLVLIGIALVFLQAGTLDVDEIRPMMADTGLIGVAAGALFIIGFGVKSALVPMHTWLPDAHSQAPSGVSAILSGLVIESGLIAMLRSLGALAEASQAWGALLLAFAALNMLIGNLMALRQTEVKRLLAYSSVAQMGYMLLGFGVALAYGIQDGAAGGFFHLFNHAVMKGLAFLAAGVLLYSLHIARGSHAALTLDDLNGASRRYPITAFALSIALLGLGGLPPLSGFMSKWQIFLAGAEVRSTPLLWLVIFAGLNSVLSLGYYAPMVSRLYRREPSPAVLQGAPAPVVMALPVVLLTLATVVVGFWPAILTWLTQPAAQSLLAAFGMR